jgi:ribosomal protein S18 acetylase RimI-like enzyme
MTIRTATPEDAEGVRTVVEESWEEDYPEILSSESLTEGLEEWYSLSGIEDAIERSDSRALVAQRDGRVAGFVHAILDVDKGEGHVLRLYVRPEHRREGTGTNLLKAACEELFDSGADRVRAMVLEANEVGNQFYSGFGFDRVDAEEVDIGGEAYRENTYELRPGALSES